MYNFSKKHIFLLLFTLGYTAVAGWYFLRAGNYEFIWYIAVLLFFIIFAFATLKVSRLPLWILWLLSIWGLLHMLGGGLRVGEGVLYAYTVFPLFSDGGEFTLLKYDQLVHAYGFGVAALLFYHLLSRVGGRLTPLWVGIVSVCAAMGLGAINEIIEFTAVLFSPDGTGVGGYYNTALDLVFNATGATVAVVGRALIR